MMKFSVGLFFSLAIPILWWLGQWPPFLLFDNYDIDVTYNSLWSRNLVFNALTLLVTYIFPLFYLVLIHFIWSFFRDSSEDPFNKKSSTDPVPKINSVTFCELIAIDVNIADLKNVLLLEWVVMVSTFQ